ncbi:hypothetical protein OBBRIDRAFT_246474 [Obba rivulosa]|uniref:Uncharacterized protein n=1 Tax=Obba rivulosa TaxID=1052685 RepID=A0A8E2AKQ5_9APHY|nr:hypothetical protein OBBRIDRAFT_246474 [Obba rivulosa]
MWLDLLRIAAILCRERSAKSRVIRPKRGDHLEKHSIVNSGSRCASRILQDQGRIPYQACRAGVACVGPDVPAPSATNHVDLPLGAIVGSDILANVHYRFASMLMQYRPRTSFLWPMCSSCSAADGRSGDWRDTANVTSRMARLRSRAIIVWRRPSAAPR